MSRCEHGWYGDNCPQCHPPDYTDDLADIRERLERIEGLLAASPREVRVVDGRFTCCGSLTTQPHHLGCPIVGAKP